jgi:hypothetical protein
VKLLVNHRTITQVPRAAYSFYHIELDRHDLLLAEGLEAESYLDVAASRQIFANNSVTDLRPAVNLTDATEAAYAERGCLPLTLRAEAVKPVWDALAARAGSVAAPAQAFTRDPALHLLVNGAAVAPARRDGARYWFQLPSGTREVVVASRVCSPWASQPWIDDRRLLGVAVASACLMTGRGAIEIALAGEAALRGWYGLETDPATGAAWRWTNGAGALAWPAVPGTQWLELTLHSTVSYMLTNDAREKLLAVG